MTKSKKEKQDNQWLLLMHQLPPQPDAFRVKIWRKLQQIGAVSLKNSVYVLPYSKQTKASLEKVVAEIQSGGGEAFLCDASFLQGINSQSLVKQFNTDRDKSYGKIAEELQALLALFNSKTKPNAEKLMQVDHSLGKIQRQLSEVIAIDFFSAKGRVRVENLFSRLTKNLTQSKTGASPQALLKQSAKGYQGKTWVTRKNLYVDRLASAWLIQRFIDRKAKFKFIDADSYRVTGKQELRFDMHGGEFTHHSDLCTFETLMKVFSLKDSALTPIAEIIHDIDLNDHKYSREERAGIERMIKGMVQSESNDEQRLARAINLFDELYSTFKS